MLKCFYRFKFFTPPPPFFTGGGFNGTALVLLLVLNTACPARAPKSVPDLEGNFNRAEARTLHGIDQFQIKVPVEYLFLEEAGPVTAGAEISTGDSKSPDASSSADKASDSKTDPPQPWWAALGSFPVTEVLPHPAKEAGAQKGRWVKTSLHSSFLERITDKKGLSPVGHFKVKVRDKNSGTVREAVVKRVLEDWSEATALTEEDLTGLGALRIKTSKGGEEVKNSISQVGAFIDPKSQVSFINRYYRVDYTLPDVRTGKDTNLESVKNDPKKLLAFLLGEVNNFHGFPETDYYILPRLEGNFLILYRLGRSDKIPFDERSMALKAGDWLATPLVGYPVEFCISEKHETAHFEKTDLDVAVCEGVSVSSARYVRFQTMKRQVFGYQPKLDIFPADFFRGAWFYVRTIVTTSEKDAASVGHQAFEVSHLVEFRKKPEHLEVVDAGGYKLDDKDKVVAVFIPVNWKEYDLDQDTNIFKSFSERERTKTPDVKRPYFQLDFGKLAALEIPKNSKTKAVVRRVYIRDDYFSFDIEVIEEKGSPFVVRYTFKKTVADTNYPERAWYKEDTDKIIPVFSSKRRYYKTSVETTRKDQDRFMRVNRFDPTQETIRWHFSAQTPRDKWVRDFGRRAVAYKNKMFEAAGRPSGRKIEVVLDESDDQSLGSLGYNIINLVVTESQTAIGSYGFGPNISNPITGEVVSATANVWVSSILDSYIVKLRQYIRLQIWPLPWKFLPTSNGISDYLEERIKALCPEVDRFIESQKGRVTLHPTRFVVDGDEDKRVQISCGKKLAEPAILWTVLHEMHHGFGFRHVFGASADVENFYKDYDEIRGIFGDGILNVETESFKKPAGYASTMDYVNLDYPILTVPGKYDIGAVRYLYFDELELKDGGVMDLSEGEGSVLERARAQNIDEDRIKFQACNLTKLDSSSNTIELESPLCAKFDYGSAPKEVVEYKIRGIKDYMMSSPRRYDRSDERFKKDMVVSRPFLGLVPYIGKWLDLRKEFLTAVGKQAWDYSPLNEADLKEYEKIMTEAMSRNKDLQSYYEVVPILSDFMMEIMNFPFKQCVYEKPDGSFHSVAFEVIRSRIAPNYPEGSREVFINCESESVRKWARESGAGTFVTEVGTLVAPAHSYFIKPVEGEDIMDELSIIPLRFPLMVQFLSSLVFDPPVQRRILEAQEANWLRGQDINPYINDSARIRDLRTARGMSVNCRPLQPDPDLPECEPLFPRFSMNEIREKHWPRKLGEKPTSGNLIALREIVNLVSKNTRSERVKQEILEAYGFVSIPDMKEFQVKTGHLTRDPSRAVSEMSVAFGTSAPFILQSYEDYLRSYNTPEKQKEISFITFLREQPFVINYDIEAEISYMPFTKESGNMYYESGFRQYNEYKACIAEESCADREEKKAFVHLMDNLLKP